MTRVGIALLPEINPAEDSRWARLEEYGFAHAWCIDHLAWRALADSPWHATVPTLAAAALTTSKIALGTFVASPNFRHPVLFSKELMTLDVMSGGRLLVGVGAGGPGYDAVMLGGPELTLRQRADRFEEFVTLLDTLLRQRRTTWTGSWYSAVDARTIPGSMQRPRPNLVVAGNGPRGMRLALRRGEGWACSGGAPFGSEPDLWWAGLADTVRRFEDVAAAAGGISPGFRRYVDMQSGAGPISSVEKARDDIGRAVALGFTDIVLPWPRDSEPFQAPAGVLEELAADLRDRPPAVEQN